MVDFLKVLKDHGVTRATFFQTGDLESVVFGSAEEKPDPVGEAEPDAARAGKLIRPEPDKWASHREAFRVLAGKSDEAFGD